MRDIDEVNAMHDRHNTKTPPSSPPTNQNVPLVWPCGIDPAKYRVLVAKGAHAPVAAYQSVCRHFIRVNTPGVTTADLHQLNHHHRRHPLYPFEHDFNWRP